MVRLCEYFSYSDGPRLQTYAAPADRADAVAVVDKIIDAAQGAKNLFRGRALTATENNGLVLEVTELPVVNREHVIVPAAVWSEIDLNIAAVTTRRAL